MSSNDDQGEKVLTVYNVPYDVTAEQLMLHFMQRRNGVQGDVEHVEIQRIEHLQNETSERNGRKTIGAVAKVKFSSSKSVTALVVAEQKLFDVPLYVIAGDDVYGTVTVELNEQLTQKLNASGVNVAEHLKSSSCHDVDVIVMKAENADEPPKLLLKGTFANISKARQELSDIMAQHSLRPAAVDTGPPAESKFVTPLSIEISSQLSLHFVAGQLLEQVVDGIVVHAEPTLNHVGGLVESAGYKVQLECNAVMEKHSSEQLKITDVAFTSGGKLPCRYIVHAVAPDFERDCKNDSSVARRLLTICYKNALNAAKNLRLQSVAVGLIGSGLSMELVSTSFADAMADFAAVQWKSGTLREIVFTDPNCDTIAKLWSQIASQQKQQPNGEQEQSELDSEDPGSAFNPQRRFSYLEPGGALFGRRSSWWATETVNKITTGKVSPLCPQLRQEPCNMTQEKKPKSNPKAPRPSYWRSFADTTGIQGFSFITHSICFSEILLWAIILLIFLGLTANDFNNTIQAYLDGKTSITADISFNETMAFNETTFCFKIDTNLLAYGVDVRKPAETVQLLAKFANVSNIVDHLTAQVNVSDPAGIVEPELKSLVMLSASMLASIVKLENVGSYTLFRPSDDLWGISLQPIDNKSVFTVDNRTSETFALVYDFYSRRQTDLLRLRNVIAQLLVRQMYATVHCMKYPRKRHYELLSNWNVTWFGRMPFSSRQERLCLQAPPGLLEFRSSGDGCVFKSSPEAIYEDPSKTDPWITVDFAGNAMPLSDIPNIFGMPSGQQKQLDVQILGWYKSLSKPDNPCGDDIDFVECKGTCRAKNVYKKCSCWPLSWWSLTYRPTDAVQCGQGGNNSIDLRVPQLGSDECRSIHFEDQEEIACSKQCMRSCFQKILLYRNDEKFLAESAISDPDQTYENRTILYVNVPNFVYPYMEELLDFTAGKLLADLGGNFGLWLGASVISVVHVVVYLVRMCIDCNAGGNLKEKEESLVLRLRRKSSLAQQSDQKSHALHRWFNTVLKLSAQSSGDADSQPSDGVTRVEFEKLMLKVAHLEMALEAEKQRLTSTDKSNDN